MKNVKSTCRQAGEKIRIRKWTPANAGVYFLMGKFKGEIVKGEGFSPACRQAGWPGSEFLSPGYL
jgi:hypothetical protein